MGGLSGTLTSLTQLHVPELEHLYEVSIGTPHRPTGRRRAMSQRRPCATRHGPHTTSDLELDLLVVHVIYDPDQLPY